MFAKIADVKEGDVLIADGGFTCVNEGAELTIERQGDYLGFRCRSGFHDLEGQVEGDEYVGLTHKFAPSGPSPTEIRPTDGAPTEEIAMTGDTETTETETTTQDADKAAETTTEGAAEGEGSAKEAAKDE